MSFELDVQYEGNRYVATWKSDDPLTFPPSGSIGFVTVCDTTLHCATMRVSITEISPEFVADGESCDHIFTDCGSGSFCDSGACAPCPASAHCAADAITCDADGQNTICTACEPGYLLSNARCDRCDDGYAFDTESRNCVSLQSEDASVEEDANVDDSSVAEDANVDDSSAAEDASVDDSSAAEDASVDDSDEGSQQEDGGDESRDAQVDADPDDRETGGDDGCSTLPGSSSGALPVLFGFPLLMLRRRSRL